MYQKKDLKSFDVFYKDIEECIDKLDENSSVSFNFAYPCFNIKTGLKDYAKHSIIFNFSDKSTKGFDFLADDKMEESVNSNQYMLYVLIRCKIAKAHVAGTCQGGKYSMFVDIYRQINDYCFGDSEDKIVIEDLEDENFSLKDKVDELEDKVDELEDKVDELEDRTKVLEDESKEQQNEIDDLNAELDDLKDQYASLEERVAVLEKKCFND